MLSAQFPVPSAGTRSSARIRRSFSTVLRRPAERDGSDNCDYVPSSPLLSWLDGEVCYNTVGGPCGC